MEFGIQSVDARTRLKSEFKSTFAGDVIRDKHGAGDEYSSPRQWNYLKYFGLAECLEKTQAPLRFLMSRYEVDYAHSISQLTRFLQLFVS